MPEVLATRTELIFDEMVHLPEPAPGSVPRRPARRG